MEQTATIVERLLWESEGTTLDFKERQYPLAGASDQEKGEFIKDILAFANAFRRETAFILLGVREVAGGRAEVVGVTNHLDDASLQQLVSDKTNRPVEFSYHAVSVEDKNVGVIAIPRQERPSYLKRSF